MAQPHGPWVSADHGDEADDRPARLPLHATASVDRKFSHLPRMRPANAGPAMRPHVPGGLLLRVASNMLAAMPAVRSSASVSSISGSASVSASRWLVGVTASVVLCFMVASAVGGHLERAIAGRANEISANAMPSVQILTIARRDLERLDDDLARYAAAPGAQRGELRDRITTTRRDVDAAVASYAALPFFPDERPLHADIQNSLAGLEHTLSDYLADPGPDALASAHRQLDLVDEAIGRIVLFDAVQGQRLGLEIQRIHGESRGVVELLDAASVVLAIGAAYLAVRQLRRAARAQKAEREARERREAELAGQNEALGQFAGRVAHDVLSPLSAATLSLELVRHTCEQDPAAHRAAERALAAVARVHTLVDDLLAFARAGGQPEPGASSELGPVIADVLDGLGGEARQRRIALTASAVPQGPEGAIACSKGVLTSVLSNLVGNAIKYMGEAPERRIELRAVDTGARWRVEVEDTGPGIPPEQRERIFQPYVQLGRGAAGIGLGLATVDRLVRGHAGTLGVTSTPGRGSVFWFELPKPIAEGGGPPRPCGSRA